MNFAKKALKTTYINLALDTQAAKAFSQAKNVNDFLLVVSAFSTSPLIPEKTVVFIDEIQMAKDIDFQTMAKGFVLDGRYPFYIFRLIAWCNDV